MIPKSSLVAIPVRAAIALGLLLVLPSTVRAERPAAPVPSMALGSQASAPSPSSTPSKDWKRLSSTGVTVVGNAPAKELRRAALRLQQFQQTMVQLLGPLNVTSPVPNVLVVFKDDGAMGPFKPRDGRGRTRRDVAGYFSNDADVNYMVMASMRSDEGTLSVLFHEYTHYLMHRNMRRLPVWVNEGVAEFFSTYQLGGDGEGTIGAMPPFRVNAIRRGRLFPLEKLLTDQAAADAIREDGDLFYAQSWGLVHYLLLNRARQGQLTAYLNALKAGHAVEPAFREAFHASFAQLGEELRRYLQQFMLPILKLPALPDRSGQSEPAVTALREVDALQLQGDLLMRAGGHEEAGRVLTKALALDPGDLGSQIAMAGVRLKQEKPLEAVDLSRKAVEKAPRDFRAQYWLGVALAEAGRHKDALAALAAAVRINNGSPGIWHETSVAAMALEDHRNADAAMGAVQRLDSNPSWFYARARRALGLGRYEYAARDAEAYLREAGLGDEAAPYAGFVGALAYAGSKDGEKARVLLQQVKASVSGQSWQAAVAGFLDGDLTASALLDKAEGDGQKTEAHAYIGLRAAIEGRGEEALPHLLWVKEKGDRLYLEYQMAVAELKRLQP